MWIVVAAAGLISTLLPTIVATVLVGPDELIPDPVLYGCLALVIVGLITILAGAIGLLVSRQTALLFLLVTLLAARTALSWFITLDLGPIVLLAVTVVTLILAVISLVRAKPKPR